MKNSGVTSPPLKPKPSVTAVNRNFAAKSQGIDVEEVFRVFDLGGGMPLEGQQGIVTHHAAAVIDHVDEFFAATFNLDLDAGGSGVQRVFQQLFQDGDRTLDHLACSDLIGNVL